MPILELISIASFLPVPQIRRGAALQRLIKTNMALLRQYLRDLQALCLHWTSAPDGHGGRSGMTDELCVDSKLCLNVALQLLKSILHVFPVIIKSILAQ